MERHVMHIAAKQLGLVTREQALAAGLTARQIEQRLRSRRWERVHAGVYRVTGAPETWEQRVRAALLAAGSGAVASHTTAGALWDLRLIDRQAVEITVHGTQPRLRTVSVHRASALPAEDRDVVGGFPVTSAARTLVDLSAFWSPGQLSVMLDEAMRRKITSLRSVEQCVGRLASGPGRRCSVIAKLIADRAGPFIVGESHLEQLVYQPLVEAGLELPVSQYDVIAGGERFRLDFAWPDVKLYVEVDGFDTHRMLTDFHRDRRREGLLVAAGWTPLHFTDRSTPTEVVDRVDTTLARLDRQRSA